MPVLPAPLIAKLRSLGCTPAEAAALAVLIAAAVASVSIVWMMSRGHAAPAGTALATEQPTHGTVVAEADVTVHVAGAVARPGVYTLSGGSRVGEAVDAAGGASRQAVLDGLNLARVLIDGEQVVVPDRRAAATGPVAGAATSGAPSAPSAQGPTGEALVALNTATLADFETLPGIGPVLASRILEYRASIGGFTEVGQLRDVPGIGEKTFQALAPLVGL